MASETERAAMRRAAGLAASSLGLTSPNPPVGCVILAGDDVVGEGFHLYAGRDHAEVLALRAAGDKARGATAVVTLEPCSHTGRTPPCVDALLAAGVARVVAGGLDPLHGGGLEALRRNGIDVEHAPLGDPPHAAWETAVRLGRPYVTLKWAVSLDGLMAARDGSSKWVTSDDARADAHRLRGEHDAVVAGSGTVLADDPALTVRGGPPRTPLRVVADRSGRVPATARVLDGAAPTYLAREPDPAALLATLWERGVRTVLVEGGPTLAAAFAGAGLVDRVVAYVAPCLLSGAASIGDAVRLSLGEVTRIGPDVRLTGRR